MPKPTASRITARTSDLADALAGTRFREVRWFASLDSTNRYLVDEAGAGAAPGLVVVADEQSAGRGRLGRTWVAPPGASLLASALLDGDAPAEHRHLVLVAAALAAIDAVDSHCGFRPRLKWPNDLVVGDRKLAGLLAEAAGTGAIVVGMGLNVDWDAFPAEIEATATACNREGRPAPRDELLVAWLAASTGVCASSRRPGRRRCTPSRSRRARRSGAGCASTACTTSSRATRSRSPSSVTSSSAPATARATS